MKKLYKIILLPFLILFIFSNVYAGSGNRTGTSGAAQLLIPVGARGIAMGGANIASSLGLESLYWNPAGIASLNPSVNVTFSHMSYIADIGVEYGAISADIEGFGALAFNIKSLSVGDIAVTTTSDPDGTGATFKPQMLVAGVSYSRLLTDNISVGLTANLISETLGEVDATGFAFDVGVIYQNLAEINGLNFGIVMKNIGPQMEYDGAGLLIQAVSDDLNRPPTFYQANAAAFELPSTFEIGFAYEPRVDDVNSLKINVNYQNNNFLSDQYKSGLEYGYNEMFFLRGGYTLASDVESDEFIYGIALGAGLNYQVEDIALRVDYAFRDVDYFSGNHVFQISFGF